MENSNKIKTEQGSILSKVKASFTSKKFKGGAYSTAISIIVIIIVLLVNIFVTKLDLKVDVSSENMYTMTDETKEYVKTIKDDITIYYLAKAGGEEATFTEIIEKYDKLSDHISVEYKDPVQYPKFASQYVEDSVSENSVLVVNNTNGKAKYVDRSDMILSEIDYQTYQSNVTGIDVEGQVTSALFYVTTENLPVMYMLEGHGESAISETLLSSLEKINVTTNTLSLMKEKSIPEDCSILFINGPQTDYSEEELAMIKEYLAAGGDAIILVDYAAEGLVNFQSLINYYGAEFVNGIVLEGDSGYYMGQYITDIVPTLNSHDITTSIKADKAVVVAPYAVGIKSLDSKRSTIDIQPFMSSSESSYSKVNVNSQIIEKEEADIAGPFSLGVTITENYNDIETKLVVYGSSAFIEENMLSYPSIGNLDMFVKSVNFVADREDSLAIRTRSIKQQYLSLTAAEVNLWSAVVVILIPVSILALGGYICIRRRKR